MSMGEYLARKAAIKGLERSEFKRKTVAVMLSILFWAATLWAGYAVLFTDFATLYWTASFLEPITEVGHPENKNDHAASPCG